jgi:lipid-A-disaccharide synthase
MADQGMEVLYHVHDLEAIGLEIARKLPFFLSLVKKITQAAVGRGTDLAILIDYPGFNLKLAQSLRARNIPVIFYVAPQIWAWRYGRIKKIRRRVDLMLLLFRFEEEIFRQEGVPCRYVGHPLSQRVADKLQEINQLEQQGQPPVPPVVSSTKTVTLMPGSRESEIKALLPLFGEIANRLRLSFPHLRFLVPYIRKSHEQLIQMACDKYEMEPYYDQSLACIRAADLVILSSGTATLEVALLEKPMLIAYKVGGLSYHILKRLIRLPYIGMVNIMAQEMVAPEFIQKDAEPAAMTLWASKLLQPGGEREGILEGIRRVKKELTSYDPAQGSSEAVLEFVRDKLVSRDGAF